jgi:uncharacterized protein YcbX
VRLAGIFVYPVKACGGVSLESARVVERGLEHDRRYMLIDRAGVFVSQRERPELCRVATRLEPGRIVLSAPGASELALPIALERGERTPYRVWNSDGHALAHADGGRWFSDFLGDDVQLVYMPDDEHRHVNPARARADDIVSFADGYPLLLISQASLDDLNGRLLEPIEMRRFRPNLVIDGAAPYAEDGFSQLFIGELGFRAVKRCDRCSVTTVDPTTGQRGKEPLRTLAKYRLEDGKVWFGMNLIHDACGKLDLGHTVRLA